jgi:phospholipase/lecithinase/hemolysin
LEWYRRAAEQGDESAFYKIGEFYENGYGGLEVGTLPRSAGSVGLTPKWLSSSRPPATARAGLSRCLACCASPARDSPKNPV